MVVVSLVPESLADGAHPVRYAEPPRNEPAAVIPDSFKKSRRDTGMITSLDLLCDFQLPGSRKFTNPLSWRTSGGEKKGFSLSAGRSPCAD